MKLYKSLKLFKNICKQYKLNHIPVFFSSKVCCIGITYWVDNNPIAFSFSKRFILFCDKHVVEKTFRHEIAHALDVIDRGYSNHDENWKKWCGHVNHDGSPNMLPIDYYRSAMYCPTDECDTVYVFPITIPKRKVICKKCNSELTLYINDKWKE